MPVENYEEGAHDITQVGAADFLANARRDSHGEYMRAVERARTEAEQAVMATADRTR